MKLIHALLRFFAATQKSKWKQHQKWVHGSAWTFKTQQEKCCPVFSTCNLETLIVLVAEKLFCKWLFLIWERAMKLKTVLAMNLRLWNQWRLGICACRKCSGIDFFLLSTFHAYVWISAQPCYFLATKKTELQIQLGRKSKHLCCTCKRTSETRATFTDAKVGPLAKKFFFCHRKARPGGLRPLVSREGRLRWICFFLFQKCFPSWILMRTKTLRILFHWASFPKWVNSLYF